MCNIIVTEEMKGAALMQKCKSEKAGGY